MTVVSPNTLNTTLFEDGQPAGSIVPGSVRTLINSLAGRFGNTQTSSYTFVATDFGTIIPITNSAGTTATVPLNSSVAFDQGSILGVMQGGNGTVTWTPAAGVTIIPPPNKQLITNGPGAISQIWQISLNTWQAFDWGLLAPPPENTMASTVVFSSVASTQGPFTLSPGGSYGITVTGTFSAGGTVTFEILSADGATFVPVLPAFTTNGYAVIDLPPGTFQLAIATATAVFAQISEIN